ncbi:MAG: tetratricopeptide repeat protein [Thermodesulfobacteriota bacterium]
MCKKNIIPFIIIVVVGFILYSNTFYFPFVFDDISNIVENPRIRDLSNFLDISGTRYMGFLSFALNYYVDGLNLFGYHLTNILIHITNAILVYLLVSLTFKTPVMAEKPPVDKIPWLSGPYCTALVAAIIFVSHPIQTQAVTYIVQRFASLATLFYLLSLVFYIRLRLSWIEVKAKPSTFILYLLSLFSAILAMKTKEISFTLPFIIVLYEFTFFAMRNKQPADSTKKRLFYLLPFLITLLIIPLSRIEAAEGGDPLGGSAVPFSRWEYLFTEFRVMVRYIRLMFLPMDQNLDYNYPIYNSFFDPQVFLSFLFLVSIFGFAVYLLLRSRATDNRYGLIVAFGLLWFFITLSIESSIIPLQNVIFEHRLYLPSVGVIISFTTALYYWFEAVWKRWRVNRERRQVLICTACFLLINSVFAVSLSIATYRRNLVWKDNETLWADTVSKSPGKPKLHYNLGIAYMEKGRFNEAVEAYKKAIELDPAYFDARNNLGITYQELGMYDKALSEFKESLKINPNHFKAHHNLGLVYNNKGYIDKAIQEYRIASRINPDYAETHNNLGVAYAAQGRIEDAVREYMITLKLEPDSAKIHYNIANAYYNQKRLNDAAKEFQAALELEPDNAESYYGLGLVYSDLKRYPDALKIFQTALKIKPDHSESYNNIGNIYLMQGRVEMAIEEYRKALRADSDNIEVYYNLASSLERIGKIKKALENYRVFVERASPEYKAVVLEVKGRIDKLIIP